MNCLHCEERLSDYLEGALSAAERDSIDLHLQACAACTQLLAGMKEVLAWGKSFPVYDVPARLPLRIMNCFHCEERMSDYLEGALSAAERDAFDLHLRSCAACTQLLAGMTEVLAWGKAFPVYDAPAWLPVRIIANTPRVERETWIDTLAAAWKRFIDPRVTIGVFTATLMLGWMGSLAGFSPDWRTVVRNPAAIYYEAQGAMNRAYDEALRTYYRSPLITQIKTRIDQLREIS